MPATEPRPAFRQRVRTVTRQMWALHVGRGIARAVAATAALVATAAAVDYLVELPFPVRLAVFAAGSAAVALFIARWVVRPARAWGGGRVAAVLEGLFPRLGQRLRTALEYGPRSADELARCGVAPGLVAALEEETAERVKPLPFEAALPVRPVLLAVGAGVLCAAGLAASAALAPEWWTALRRVTLAPLPYTTLSVTASADQVDEGADVEIHAALSGRARTAAVLHVRESGESDWREEAMDTVDGGFAARVAALRATTEFFVSAGPDRSPTRLVVVRRPLRIESVRVEVRSPSYTGVAPVTHETGSFSTAQGSTARFLFELDRPPAIASLMVRDPAKPATPPRRLNMAVQGRQIVAELPLTADIEYTVDARDDLDVPVVTNRHRVRVTADQPPTVWCDEPAESVEVHTLAELLVRARARDDFGISKIGIVFQVNNEEERTLVIHDVKEPFQQAALAEQVLMLEQFLLTEKDCVAYYAFAEDNRPGTPQRATTDLRFIDIRPFRRTYTLLDAPEGMGGPQRELIFLDEVIARQRYNLNQTIRLETRSKVRLDVAQVDRVAAFENKLATQTHDLADFLAGLGVDGAALLTQAEETMLSAVDSLHGAKFATAIGQERDALRYLMEARNTIQLALPKTPKSVRAQARAFDRLQRQKLRRQNEGKAETLAELAAELARLADEEDDVARSLTAGGMQKGGGAGDPAKPPPAPDKSGPDSPDPAKPPADPVQERQDGIAARATVVDKTATTIKELTGLARARIADAAKAANAAADAIGQRDRAATQKNVDRARELFRLASKQVAALAAEEAAQQLAAARDLANDVARLAAPADSTKNPGMGAGEKASLPGLGTAAEQAKTLKDLLEQVAGSGSQSSAEAARRAGELLKSEDLAAAIDRLEKPGAGADRAERQDLAERFAALGQKLDQAYRDLVAPRLEELARLEQDAAELERRLAAATDATAQQRARQQVAEFVERLEAARLGDLAADLREGRGAGTGERGGFGTSIRSLAVVRERLIAKLQEFLASDRLTTGSETVPPEYRDLVERYLRALSAGSSK